MNLNYRTDAERSVLKPAGPYLIEKSYDSVPQSHKAIRPIVVRPTAAPRTTIAPFVRSTSPPKQR